MKHKHTYSVTGMSCKNCRAHVMEALSKVGGVTAVDVDLEKAEAVIEMNSHIPIEKFQEALELAGGHYGIHPHGRAPVTKPK
ncbi:MAG: heavy-metal-associated domain-containing protein, partial [Chloroflexota bacterium]